MTGHGKAIVISDFWASIFGTVLVAILTASAAYAWSSNERLAILQTRVNTVEAVQITQVSLPSRLATIEEQLRTAASDREQMRKQQQRMEDKLDITLGSVRRGH